MSVDVRKIYILMVFLLLSVLSISPVLAYPGSFSSSYLPPSNVTYTSDISVNGSFSYSDVYCPSYYVSYQFGDGSYDSNTGGNSYSKTISKSTVLAHGTTYSIAGHVSTYTDGDCYGGTPSYSGGIVTYQFSAVVIPVANFTASPTTGYNPLNVSFIDTSTNSPTSYKWIFGDNGTSIDSTAKNTSHIYQNVGIYTVNHSATNAAGTSWKNVSQLITVAQTLHLDLDVKDPYTNAYIAGATIGIYDPLHNEWRNSTCVNGACGFVDSGYNHQYPLQIGQQYRLAATKSGYSSDSQSDHQLVTLLIHDLSVPTPTPTGSPTWPTPTPTGPTLAPTPTYDPNAIHLDVDIKDYNTGNYLAWSTIGIYDPLHGEWRNNTCSYGACGYQDSGATHQYPLVIGHVYTVAAKIGGYNEASQTVTLAYDHQLVTLRLVPNGNPNPTPTPTYDPNALHIDLDVKNNVTKQYIAGATIGIYDPAHGVWRNSACEFGACGFQDSGPNHEFALGINQHYTLAASAPGYNSSSKTIQLVQDHQLFTLYLDPNGQNTTPLHMDLDIKDRATGQYIQNATVGIYDPIHNEWRNSTSATGATGFMTSGTTGQYPLQLYYTYTLAASKTGYNPAYQTAVLAFDHQLFTLYLSNSSQNITPGQYHLDLDIRDGSNNGFIQGSTVGIYDPVYSVWRNSTCADGACGFMTSGANQEYPLVLGQSYTVAASKTNFSSSSDTVTLNYDHQLVTLMLRPLVPNASVLHLDVDIKDSINKSYIQDATIGIFDPVHGEWRNSTCGSGACGFMDSGASHQWPLIYYNTYTITASKAGYRSASQTLVPSLDHQLFTLYLTPNDKVFVTVTPTGRAAQAVESSNIWIDALPMISALLAMTVLMWVINIGGLRKKGKKK